MNQAITQPIRFRGTEFTTGDTRRIADAIVALSQANTGTTVRLVNFNTIMNMRTDPAYMAQVNQDGINLLDSTPLAWILSRASRSTIRPSRGPDVFRAALDQGQAAQTRHFLLGSTPDVLEKLEKNISQRYPLCIVVGKHSPPFRQQTASEVASQDNLIRATRPHIIWVGLGGKLQDVEAARLAETIPGVAVGIGAAFDFLAGSKSEAPPSIRHSGFEWMFRLTTEPRRLLPRYIRQIRHGLAWVRGAKP